MAATGGDGGGGSSDKGRDYPAGCQSKAKIFQTSIATFASPNPILSSLIGE